MKTKYKKLNYKRFIERRRDCKIYAILFMGYLQGHIIVNDKHGKYPKKRGHWYTSMDPKQAYQDYLYEVNNE